MRRVLSRPLLYQKWGHDCQSRTKCKKTHFKIHLGDDEVCYFYVNNLNACSLRDGISVCERMFYRRIRVEITPMLLEDIRAKVSRLLCKFGFTDRTGELRIYELDPFQREYEHQQLIGVPLNSTDNSLNLDVFSNRFGRIIDVGDAAAISKLDFSHGRIKFNGLKFSTRFACDPREEDIYLRFYLSKPLSPIVYQFRVSPCGGNAIPVEITLDFPLGKGASALSGKDVAERYLNVWAFSEFSNEKFVTCINPSGVSNTQIAKIYNWSLLDDKSKKSMHICRTDIVLSYVSEEGMQNPAKGSIDFVGVESLEATKIEKIIPKLKSDLHTSIVPGAFAYCASIRGWFVEQSEPSYGFMSSIHAYTYVTDGKIPAAMFWFMDLHKPIDKPSDFPIQKGNVAYSGEYSLEKILWIHLLKLAARRFHPSVDEITTLLSRTSHDDLGNILGTALTAYSNYCQYIPDLVYAPVPGSSIPKKIGVERFDRQCGRDSCDCEDGACYVNYLVATLRAIYETMDGTPVGDTDKVLQKFGEFINNYYSFTCIAAVSDSSYSESEHEFGKVTDAELLKHDTMQAHAFAVLIPKSDVYTMLKKIEEKNLAVIREGDRSLGVEFPVIFCETTGNLVPVAVNDIAQVKNYGGLGDLMQFLDDCRPLNVLHPDKSRFYRVMSTLMTPDFSEFGVYEFTLVLQRKKDSISKWSYGVPYSNIVSKTLETPFLSVGMFAQKRIPDELFASAREVLENDYPLSTIVPAAPEILRDSGAEKTISAARAKIETLKTSLKVSSSDRRINHVDYKCYTTFVPYQEVARVYSMLYKLIEVMKGDSSIDITEEQVCLSCDGKSVIGGYMISIITNSNFRK